MQIFAKQGESQQNRARGIDIIRFLRKIMAILLAEMSKIKFDFDPNYSGVGFARRNGFPSNLNNIIH